jgi:hypothetical protein
MGRHNALPVWLGFGIGPKRQGKESLPYKYIETIIVIFKYVRLWSFQYIPSKTSKSQSMYEALRLIPSTTKAKQNKALKFRHALASLGPPIGLSTSFSLPGFCHWLAQIPQANMAIKSSLFPQISLTCLLFASETQAWDRTPPRIQGNRIRMKVPPNSHEGERGLDPCGLGTSCVCLPILNSKGWRRIYLWSFNSYKFPFLATLYSCACSQQKVNHE